MGATNIEWTDETWNPTRGCSRVSPGCENCYAERQAIRHAGAGGSYEGLVRSGKNGPRWTGKMRLVPEMLGRPLSWKEPRRVFVNSMSDLFHERVNDEDIAAVFGVMAACPQHTFQVLTKRSERMAHWFAAMSKSGDPVSECAHAAEVLYLRPRTLHVDAVPWPLPNVWLGVSVEDQKRADERLPQLDALALAGWLTWASYEPALEAVSFGRALTSLRWMVIGGESGPGARPFDLSWAYSALIQCSHFGVAPFVKQLGAVPVMSESMWRARGTRLLNPRNDARAPAGTVPLFLHDRKGGDMAEWPADLRVREFPNAA